MSKELAYFSAPLLQRLLIDRILMAKLRLFRVEDTYTQSGVGQSLPLASADYWDHLFSSAQARFLRAIETLARVCHRSLQNQPVGVESKPAPLRRVIHIRFLDVCKGLFNSLKSAGSHSLHGSC